jgi:16S rRNA (adenine1518-N6/adenine1519-N6)-dimethyltransferase
VQPPSRSSDSAARSGTPGAARPRLKKRLGQHHLRHPEACRPLVEFLGRGEGPLLEIGPGGGVLTAELLGLAETVLAVELDLSWGLEVGRRFSGRGLALWIGDALDLPWERLAEGTRVTGNLPYGVATRLIEEWLDHAPRLGVAGFLVQYEVAQRLCAEPGSRDYGSLSVLVRARARPELLAKVRPGSFRPPPKVESGFVGLVPRADPVVDDWPSFKRTLRAAFRHKRKTLRRALASTWGRDAAARALDAARIAPDRRAETLELSELIALHRARPAP